MNFGNAYFLILLAGILLTRVGAIESRWDVPMTDDDIADTPDIEVDESLKSEVDPDANLKNHESPDDADFLDDMDIPTGEPIANPFGESPLAHPQKSSAITSPTVKKSQLCDPSNPSAFCLCKRACFPGIPTSLEPCDCGTGAGNTLFLSPPLLASQPVFPSYSPIESTQNGLFDCSQSINAEFCNCQKACIPGIPVNFAPCTCMAFENNDVLRTAPQFGLEPQSMDSTYSASPFPGMVHLDENSCTRACTPYAVRQQLPCQCNFDLRAAFPSNSFIAPSPLDLANRASTFQYPQSQYDESHQSKASPFAKPQFKPEVIRRLPPPASSIGAYLGCFKDRKNPGRDLKMNVAVPKLTSDACINKCREKKKRFAGLQNGYLCFCGSRFGRYGRIKDERCGAPCSGDPKKYCGGHWANAIYSTDGQIYSPKQFSFQTPDPVDEIRVDNELKKIQSKLKKKKRSKKIAAKTREIAPSAKQQKPVQPSNQKKAKESSLKQISSKRTIPRKDSIDVKTRLETAKSPFAMAEIIATGSKAPMAKGDKRSQQNNRKSLKLPIKHLKKSHFQTQD